MKGKILFSGGPFDDEAWSAYRVRWQFVSRLCGSAPQQGVLERHIHGLGPTVFPPSKFNIPETQERIINSSSDVAVMQEEAEQRSTVKFWTLGDKIVVPAYSIRAHIKDCARQVRHALIGKIKGEKVFEDKVVQYLYVQGEILDAKGVDANWVKRNGNQLTEKDIDGVQDRTMQIVLPGRGRVSAIKQFPYLLKPEIIFNIRIFGNMVKIEDLKTILMYGATHGFGGERSMGEGRYRFTVEEA